MQPITVELPQSLHRVALELAKMQGISLELFVHRALAEKVVALIDESNHDTRAKNGSVRKFRKVSGKDPDVEPDDADRI